MPPQPHGIHGPGCTCNPESALKIQFLRLVHNFIDRDSDNSRCKQLLLSPAEVDVFYGAGAREGGDRQRSGRGASSSAASSPSTSFASSPSLPAYRRSLGGVVAAARKRLSGLQGYCALQSPGDLSAPGSLAPPFASDSASVGRSGGAGGAGGPTSSSHPPPGLLSKILAVLVREPTESAFRFWMASCAEAFLRGSDPCDQALVASSGLMGAPP